MGGLWLKDFCCFFAEFKSHSLYKGSGMVGGGVWGGFRSSVIPPNNSNSYRYLKPKQKSIINTLDSFKNNYSIL